MLFLGKLGEVRQLAKKRPELIPFLPLKIVIFAEEDQTIVSAVNPLALGQFFDDEEIRAQLGRWEADLRSILDEVRQQGETDFFLSEVSEARFRMR